MQVETHSNMALESFDCFLLKLINGKRPWFKVMLNLRLAKFSSIDIM